jgi:hypothetical protein
MKYLMPSIYWRALLLISGIIWLFMLRDQPVEEASPRSYQVTLIVAMLALAFPFVLEIASGISCLCSGVVLSLSSGSIQSWVNYIAPIMILTHFVFPQIKAINSTRNSHCTPGSEAERTFKRNRKITLVAAGSAIVFLCLGYVGYCVSKRFHHPGGMVLSALEYIAFFDYCIAFFAFLISWIMLSIMAFRQLPNPLGYKIYNIVCQIITWGSLLVAFLVSDGMDERFATLFLISFSTFFITTTIRVISYSLPK